MNPVSFVLICLAGWMNRHQQVVVEYLQEETHRELRMTPQLAWELAEKEKRLGTDHGS